MSLALPMFRFNKVDVSVLCNLLENLRRFSLEALSREKFSHRVDPDESVFTHVEDIPET